MVTKLTPAEEMIHTNEVKEWLLAFHSNASLAFSQIPNHIYAFLRDQGLIDVDLSLSPQGLNLLGAT